MRLAVPIAFVCAISSAASADGIGPFEEGQMAGLMLSRGNGSFAFRVVADAGGLSDETAVRENITELGPYAPDASYARLRWRAVPQKPNAFSVRWTGNFRPMSAGDYVFRVEGKGGARVRIGPTTIIDAWNAGAALDAVGTTTLPAELQPITVEFRSSESTASILLSYRNPSSVDFEPIPSVAFTHGDHVGLQATLFRDDELRVPLRTYLAPQVSASWDSNSPPKKNLPTPELTLEWSRITAANAVGKLSMTAGETTATLVHIPAHAPGGTVSVSANKVTARSNGQSFALNFSEAPLKISTGGNSSDALRKAEAIAESSSTNTAPPAVALTFNLQQNKPIYFSASIGTVDRFAPQEIERRLRLTRTRYAENRLKTEGTLAGAAETMANVTMWTHAGAIHTTHTTYIDLLSLLPLAVIDPATARNHMLAVLAAENTMSPGVPFVIHRVFLRDRSHKSWLEQCYAPALRHYAAATTSPAHLGFEMCGLQDPQLAENLLCADTEALAEIATVLGRNSEAQALAREYQRRRQQIEVMKPPAESATLFARAFSGSTATADAADAIASFSNPKAFKVNWMLPSGKTTSRNFDPASPCSGAVMPAINWIACDGLRRTGHPLEAVRLAEHGSALFTGIASSRGAFPRSYNSQTGDPIGPRLHASSALLALAAISEFADVTTEGLRIGSLTGNSSTIHNLQLEGARHSIRIGKSGVRALRDGKLLVESTKPVIFHRVNITSSEAHFSTLALEPGFIRFARAHEITSAVMDSRIQVLTEDNLLRCPPGRHEFRITFASP